MCGSLSSIRKGNFDERNIKQSRWLTDQITSAITKKNQKSKNIDEERLIQGYEVDRLSQ